MIRLKLSTPRHLFLFLIAVSLVFPQLPAIALSKQPANKEEKTTSKCTAYKFIGMRGSGQAIDKSGGIVGELGPEMASLYGHLKNLGPLKGKISYSAVDEYPAVGVPTSLDGIYPFLTSLGTISTEELIREFEYELSRCPSTKFIIAGYSQGAYAAQSLIRIFEKQKRYLRDQIVGVILLANPSEGNKKSNRGILTDNKINSLVNIYQYAEAFSITLNLSKYEDSGALGKALYGVTPLEEPRKDFLAMYSYYKSGDVVADFSDLLERAIRYAAEIVLPSKINKVSATTDAFFKLTKDFERASVIHSSYCARSGEYAPRSKEKRSVCDEQANREFLKGSESYILKQLKILEGVEAEREKKVKGWFGESWQIPKSCRQVEELGFAELKKELSSDSGYLAFTFRILALSESKKQIWLMNENRELVSYSAKDGLYSLEGFEKVSEEFDIDENYKVLSNAIIKTGLFSNLVLTTPVRTLEVDDWECHVDLGITSNSTDSIVSKTGTQAISAVFNPRYLGGLGKLTGYDINNFKQTFRAGKDIKPGIYWTGTFGDTCHLARLLKKSGKWDYGTYGGNQTIFVIEHGDILHTSCNWYKPPLPKFTDLAPSGIILAEQLGVGSYEIINRGSCFFTVEKLGVYSYNNREFLPDMPLDFTIEITQDDIRNKTTINTDYTCRGLKRKG